MARKIFAKSEEVKKETKVNEPIKNDKYDEEVKHEVKSYYWCVFEINKEIQTTKENTGEIIRTANKEVYFMEFHNAEDRTKYFGNLNNELNSNDNVIVLCDEQTPYMLQKFMDELSFCKSRIQNETIRKR